MDVDAAAWVGGGVLQGHSNGPLPNMDLDSHSSDVPPHAAIVACGAAIHGTSSCSGSLALLPSAAKPQPTESDASACEVFWWHPFNSAPGPSIGQCLELPRLQVSSLNTRALLWGKALNICAFSLLTSRMSSVL